MSVYQDLLATWNQLTSALSTLPRQRVGFHPRRTLQRQRVEVQRNIRQTPEFRQAFAACKRRADATPFGQAHVNPSNLRCDVIVTPPSYEGGTE